ncbi:hypothetical protein T11_7225 [Trichinella zimbabwensis]|uniref:Uncharacterized protein n=1 Tax=Trichinella zimbabwensis TaxID=268475 RepID=A0A0V1HQP7_9BILA|nr:hypothetical protein T11_7225 [Trichinella zimbabwensis]
MHDQLVVCQEDKMSSFGPMLKVMKTQIEGKQLAPKRTALVTLLRRRESPQWSPSSVAICSFFSTMCSGDAQLLMDGRMIPNSS